MEAAIFGLRRRPPHTHTKTYEEGEDGHGGARVARSGRRSTSARQLHFARSRAGLPISGGPRSFHGAGLFLRQPRAVSTGLVPQRWYYRDGTSRNLERQGLEFRATVASQYSLIPAHSAQSRQVSNITLRVDGMVQIDILYRQYFLVMSALLPSHEVALAPPGMIHHTHTITASIATDYIGSM